MNSRFCRWLIVSALLITASSAWAQCKPAFGAQNIATLKQQAAHGKAAAQCSLGAMYEDGKGVPQNYAQAVAWWRKAAEQGEAEAQWRLGYMYFNGRGVPQDFAEAYFWNDLAAAGKLDAPFAKDVATFRDAIASHLTPEDLSREQERARKWFEAHQAKPQ